MNWIKRNWLSLLAIVLSVIAVVRCEPFIFKDSALEWIIGISIALIGIGVTALIGIQIYNAMSIDRLIRNGIEKERMYFNDKLNNVANESKIQLMSYVGFLVGLIQASNEQYDSFMDSLLATTIKAHQYGFDEFAIMSIDHLMKQVDALRKNGYKFSLDKKTKEQYIRGLAGINSPRLNELLEFIISTGEHE